MTEPAQDIRELFNFFPRGNEGPSHHHDRQSERTRGDALSKRFEEALKQARDEPITKPSRDFDLD